MYLSKLVQEKYPLCFQKGYSEWTRSLLKEYLINTGYSMATHLAFQVTHKVDE